MDSYIHTRRETERIARLTNQIESMLLDNTIDYKRIVSELDYECSGSPDRLEIVKVLCKLRQSELCAGGLQQKKLRKLISHYAIEHDNVMVLRPGKN